MGSSVDNYSPASQPAPARCVSGAPDLTVPQQGRCDTAGYVRMEMRTNTLFGLLSNRSLVIEDLRALDGQAQRCLRQLLLDALSLYRLRTGPAL